MRTLRVGALVGWALLMVVLPPLVSAAGPVVPDPTCADASTYKSLEGKAKAVLQVFNKSPLAVKVYWLDYNGKRVLYQDLPAFTSYNQQTWLTHPWVITTTDGQCLRFLVMTSQLQAVTVEGEPPDPDTTALPLSARRSAAPPTPAPPTPAPTPQVTTPPVTAAPPTPGSQTGAASTPSATLAPASSSGGSGNTGLVAAVAVAAVVVGVGAAAATGRLPGRRRGRR